MKNKETLKLKHLAPYLPYRLKGLAQNEFYSGEIETINSLCEDEIVTSADCITYGSFKPILIPLSYLTKEIEVNGEKFVPIEKLKERDSDIEFLGFYQSTFAFIIDEKAVGIMAIPYYIIQQLIEWHFDIFNLIEKGLAVDINTI